MAHLLLRIVAMIDSRINRILLSGRICAFCDVRMTPDPFVDVGFTDEINIVVACGRCGIGPIAGAKFELTPVFDAA